MTADRLGTIELIPRFKQAVRSLAGLRGEARAVYAEDIETICEVLRVLEAALTPAAGDGCHEHGKAAVESLTLYGCGCSVHENSGGANRIGTAPPPADAVRALVDEATFKTVAMAVANLVVMTPSAKRKLANVFADRAMAALSAAPAGEEVRGIATGDTPTFADVWTKLDARERAIISAKFTELRAAAAPTPEGRCAAHRWVTDGISQTACTRCGEIANPQQEGGHHDD